MELPGQTKPQQPEHSPSPKEVFVTPGAPEGIEAGLGTEAPFPGLGSCLLLCRHRCSPGSQPGRGVRNGADRSSCSTRSLAAPEKPSPCSSSASPSQLCQQPSTSSSLTSCPGVHTVCFSQPASFWGWGASPTPDFLPQPHNVMGSGLSCSPAWQEQGLHLPKTPNPRIPAGSRGRMTNCSD